jgi:hypothetical protein
MSGTGSQPTCGSAAGCPRSPSVECRPPTSAHERYAAMAKVWYPPMLLKKSLLQRGKSLDSLDYEGIGGFRHDGHPKGTGATVL